MGVGILLLAGRSIVFKMLVFENASTRKDNDWHHKVSTDDHSSRRLIYQQLPVILMPWQLLWRLGFFFSDACFSSSGAGYIIILWRGYILSCSYQLCEFLILISHHLFLKFYFTCQLNLPDWARQQPTMNSGTGHGVPFYSTSHYLQTQLATVFHCTRRT